MNVLHVHISDYHKGGGGGIAMYRLHDGLRRAGVDSKIICKNKTIDSPDIAQLPRIRRFNLESRLEKITSRLGLNDIHRLGSFLLTQHPFYKEADVVHFHGTHSGTFSYLAFPIVTRSTPGVFTLHDTWALTGHCAYSYDCERWKIGCGNCRYPKVNPPVRRDATHIEWKLKNWSFRHADMSLVAPSTWVMELVPKSMLSTLPAHRIPYGIDTDVYRPLDTQQCRRMLGIPEENYVLLFVAQNLKNTRKGGDLLVDALQRLPATIKARTTLLTMGRNQSEIADAVGMPARSFGYVVSDHLKAIVYSAADLFLFPTRADTFGLVSIESQACGTPVVSFCIAGVPDHVRPGVTGYLAEPENSESFAHGIVSLLEDGCLRESMRKQCRAIAEEEYSLDVYVQRHIDLYDRLAQ